MLKTAIATLAALATVQTADSLELLVTERAIDAADAYVRPDPQMTGTEWRPPIVEGRFTTHLCEVAVDVDVTAFFGRIAERFELTPAEHDQLIYECAIWEDGHRTPTFFETWEPSQNTM